MPPAYVPFTSLGFQLKLVSVSNIFTCRTISLWLSFSAPQTSGCISPPCFSISAAHTFKRSVCSHHFPGPWFSKAMVSKNCGNPGGIAVLAEFYAKGLVGGREERREARGMGGADKPGPQLSVLPTFALKGKCGQGSEGIQLDKHWDGD